MQVRVDDGFPKRFKRIAGKYGNPSDVHRELLTAFVEGRVSIRPNDKPKLEDLT